MRESGKDLTLHLPEAEIGCGAEAAQENDGPTAVFTASEKNGYMPRNSLGFTAYSVIR